MSQLHRLGPVAKLASARLLFWPLEELVISPQQQPQQISQNQSM
jgi:hypothetical protein